MKVSLIFTVKNEAEALPPLLDSILAQTRPPDEIIVTDGGSTDGTLALLREYSNRLPLQVLSAPGANISQGRNAAIRAAGGQVICSTDAGVRLDPNWIAEITLPFTQPSEAGLAETEKTKVVSGFFVADPCSVFETALAATTLPSLKEIPPTKFLPSSRSVAFDKSAWLQVGGYPEWLDYCEDLIFDLALRAQNFRFVFAPRALVYFRPRSTLAAFFKQYYRYARGDGKADLWLHRHVIRYATYLLAFPLSLVLLFSDLRLPALCILAFGFLAMLLAPYRRLVTMIHQLSITGKLSAIAWVPIIRVTGDVAKMIGYPVGVYWRLRRGLQASAH